jgi:predicted transglutaminase-like cysteine proteinase
MTTRSSTASSDAMFDFSFINFTNQNQSRPHQNPDSDSSRSGSEIFIDVKTFFCNDIDLDKANHHILNRYITYRVSQYASLDIEIMICEFAFRQIFCYLSRIISVSWTTRSEKFYLTIVTLMSIELITTAKEKCLQILWKRSVSMLNIISIESRIKLSESSITIAIYSTIFNSESMSCTTSFSSKCQSSSSQCQKSSLSSKRRSLSSHTRIHSWHTLKMSEKMLDINQLVNQLINQSQSIRVNQLISRHQLFRPHSGKRLINHYISICHIIHSTLQSISSITRSSIIRTINHSTNQSISTHQSISMHQSISTRFLNHRVYHTSAIKFDSLCKHLNRIYLNQFNQLHLNHLNHFHFRLHQHQHLNPLQNQFISINHSMSRMIIIQDSWHY